MLAAEILEEFADVRFAGLRERLPSAGFGDLRRVYDPHPDAERWIAAAPDERDRLRKKYEEELRAIVAARGVVSPPPKRARAAYMREYRSRPEAREKNRAACAAYRRKRSRRRRRVKKAARAAEEREAYLGALLALGAEVRVVATCLRCRGPVVWREGNPRPTLHYARCPRPTGRTWGEAEFGSGRSAIAP